MILPRFIRLRDAAGYLGMDRQRFNEEVRPHLAEIPIGERGIAIDRLDLDAWAEDYKSCNARPKTGGNKPWGEKEYLGSANAGKPGTLKSKSLDVEFTKALALATSKKQSNS